MKRFGVAGIKRSKFVSSTIIKKIPIPREEQFPGRNSYQGKKSAVAPERGEGNGSFKLGFAHDTQRLSWGNCINYFQ